VGEGVRCLGSCCIVFRGAGGGDCRLVVAGGSCCCVLLVPVDCCLWVTGDWGRLSVLVALLVVLFECDLERCCCVGAEVFWYTGCALCTRVSGMVIEGSPFVFMS